MNKKQKLIDALKKERDLFASRNQDTYEHDLAINYLETGEIPARLKGKDLYDHELLDAAVNDFDTLCSDYE